MALRLPRQIPKLIIGTCSLIVVFACGVKAGNPDTDKKGDDKTPSGMLYGKIVKGPVKQAIVDFYALNKDGSKGELLTSSYADDEGNFTSIIESESPILIESYGGSYIDEASGNEVFVKHEAPLLSVVSLSDNDKPYVVTPFTTITTKYLQTNYAGNLAQLSGEANNLVNNIFDLNSLDIYRTIPCNLLKENENCGAESAEFKYGLLISGLSQLILDKKLQPEDIFKAIYSLTEDFSDGVLDDQGKNGESCSSVLSSGDIKKGLSSSSKKFLDSPKNKSKIKSSEASIDSGEGDENGSATDTETGTGKEHGNGNGNGDGTDTETGTGKEHGKGNGNDNGTDTETGTDGGNGHGKNK